MSLPWVRLDSNVYTHDKMLLLSGQRDGYRAICTYLFSMGYSGGHGTDGFIPKHVLPIIQGTERVARMLVDAQLWEYAEGGWTIRNWGERQELSVVSAMKRAGNRIGGAKSACVRNHGPDCGCWRGVLDEIGGGIGAPGGSSPTSSRTSSRSSSPT